MLKGGILFLIIILILPIVYSEEINIPETFKSENVEVTSYFYIANNLVATKDSSGVKYYNQDRLGNNRLTTDSISNKIGETKTLPFGEEVVNDNKFSFTGKELDSELYYFGARYYDASTGRFTSVDPVGIDYQYVDNNPMNLIDPDGMAENEPKKYTWGWASQQIRNLANDAALKLAESVINGPGTIEQKRKVFQSLQPDVQTKIRELAYKYASKDSFLGKRTEEYDFEKEYRGAFSGNPIAFNLPYNPSAAGLNVLRMYLKLDPITFPLSKDKPTSLTKYKDVPLYSISEYIVCPPLEEFPIPLLEDMLKMRPNNPNDIITAKENSALNDLGVRTYIDLGSYTLSIGRDDKGFYLSIFDVWDFEENYNTEWHLGEEYGWQADAMGIVGEPIGFYGRKPLGTKSEIKAELERRGN